MFKSLITAAALALTAVAAQAGTVTKNGNTLTIRGSVDEAMYNQWDRLFDNTITHVKLESGGGLVYYGMMIADDIYAARTRVVTEALGGCQSMCAEIWLSADNHVFNSNARIGFHLAYVEDVAYWQDVQDRYGFNGLEWSHKDSVMNDMINTFKFFNNKNQFGVFMQGIRSDGLLGHNMWYPSNSQLISFEGAWVKKPAGSEFKPAEKGWAIQVPAGVVGLKIGDIYQVLYTIKVTSKQTYRTELYNIDGGKIKIGWEIDNVTFDYIFTDWFEAGVLYSQERYAITKPAYVKVFSEDGNHVQWIKVL